MGFPRLPCFSRPITMIVRNIVCIIVRTGRLSAAEKSSGRAEAIRKQIAELQAELKKEEGGSTVAPISTTYGRRTPVAAILQTEDAGLFAVGRIIRVGGLVKTGRVAGGGAWIFLHISDGSCCQEMQALVRMELADAVGGYGALESAGTRVLLEGEVVKSLPGLKQKVELKVSRVLHLGLCDNSAGRYPLPKGEISLETMRECMHLRMRRPLIAAIFRIRSELAFATHDFFRSHGFVHVHTPVITTSDCEGAGKQFQVTTLLSRAAQMDVEPIMTEEEFEEMRQDYTALVFPIDEDAYEIAEKKLGKAVTTCAKAKAKKLKEMELKLRAYQAQVEQQECMVGGIERLEDGGISYAPDFFGKRAFLTVSGQMQAEDCACALSSVYAFGPTFRAEDSHTTRHLAEFIMVEPEMADADLEDDMELAEDYVRHCCRHVLDHCRPDLEFLKMQKKKVDSTALERLEQIAASPFARCSYTEAIDILKDHVKSKRVKFAIPVEWGMDLASEHERHLAEKVFQKPVIVYNYPKDIKAFYMRANDDGRTVAAMDVLVPDIGELIGGSQREERLEVLEARMKELGMDLEQYSAYLDLRRYGSVPHSGFGLGFERLMMLVTGVANIRDVIPFPRWSGHADF